MSGNESTPLLAGHTSQSPTGRGNPHRYITIQTHSPGQTKEFSVLRPDCGHAHTAVEDTPGFPTSTYYTDSELGNEEERSILNNNQSLNSEKAKRIQFIINASLYTNIVLFITKLWAWYISGSLAVAASVVDSFLDLCVQAVIYFSHAEKSSIDKDEFPAGKSRFEPVGLVICAALMFIACIQLISTSLVQLYVGEDENVSINLISILVISGVIVSKSALWLLCHFNSGISDTVHALAMDHRNDVLSNLVALLAIVLVHTSPRLWWGDSLGCILISIYIARNWFELAMEKIRELVGATADRTFVYQLTQFVNNYHPESMELDTIRAYHFGSRYLVEVDIVLPAHMSVREAHDIALLLQQAIERMEQVERAFVHVDYCKRTIDEHDVEEVARARLQESRRLKMIQQHQQDQQSPIHHHQHTNHGTFNNGDVV